MLKLVSKFGFILLICAFSLAELSSSKRYIGNAVHKDYPGMCFYNETETPIEIGSTYTPTSECVQILCREDYVLNLEYCPFYMIGDGCKVTFNKGAEYPHCCANITCQRNPHKSRKTRGIN